MGKTRDVPRRPRAVIAGSSLVVGAKVSSGEAGGGVTGRVCVWGVGLCVCGGARIWGGAKVRDSAMR